MGTLCLSTEYQTSIIIPTHFFMPIGIYEFYIFSRIVRIHHNQYRL